MASLSRKIAFVALLLFVFGCKGTAEKLDDLRQSTDAKGRLELGIYDAGLLVHEGFAALLDADELSLVQIGRAVHDCGLILEGNEFALCRADAVSTLTHLALRIPLSAHTEALEDHPNLNKYALAQVERLDAAGRILEAPGLMLALQDADKVVVEHARNELRKVTGQNHGVTPAAWQAWWEKASPGLLRDAAAASLEPLRILGSLRFPALAQARSVLGYVAARMGVVDLPELHAVCEPTLRVLARQVVVLGLQKALTDKDVEVRCEAYRGVLSVQDPSMAAALAPCWAQESTSAGRVKLLQATAVFPCKNSLATLLLALGDDERAVVLTAHAGLQRMTGEVGVPQERWWLQWYERSGKSLWP